MSPQRRMLIGQPQTGTQVSTSNSTVASGCHQEYLLRLANRLSSDMLPVLRILIVRICDPAVGDRMSHMNTFRTELSRQSLC